MKPRVHDLGDVFAERNMFLQVGLGLISLCLRFEDLVAAQGRLLGADTEKERVPVADEVTPVLRLQGCGQPPGSGGRTTPGEPVLDFLLGAAAFSQRLLRHAEEAGASPSRRDRRAVRAGRPLRGVLT